MTPKPPASRSALADGRAATRNASPRPSPTRDTGETGKDGPKIWDGLARKNTGTAGTPSSEPTLGGPRFCFTGEVSSPTSWGRIAREILMAARDLEMPLAVRPVKGYAYDSEYPLPEFLLKLIERPPIGKIQVSVQPAFCAHLPEQAAQAWACTSFCIPPTAVEVDVLKGFQSIWVFSEDHRQALAKAGIPLDSIRALPLSVHLKTFHLRVPRHPEIPRDERFRFLWVGNALRRKGVDLVLRAYLEEFKASEPVELVIKLTHMSRIKKQYDYEIPDLAKRLGAINALFPKVRVETGCWSDKDLAGLMTSCQTLVSADRAYFTGMVVREGMACGLPVIGPGMLKSLAGLSEEIGWLVNTKETVFPEGILFPGSPEAPGSEVEIADLRRAMREAFTQPALARRKGVEAARRQASGNDWRGAAQRLQAEGALPQESRPSPRESLPGITARAPVSKRPDSAEKKPEKRNHGGRRKPRTSKDRKRKAE